MFVNAMSPLAPGGGSEIHEVYQSLNEYTKEVPESTSASPVESVGSILLFKHVSSGEIIALCGKYGRFELSYILLTIVINAVFFVGCLMFFLWIETRRHRQQLEKKKEVLEELRPKVLKFVNLMGKNMEEKERLNLTISLISNELMKYNWQYLDNFDFANFDNDAFDVSHWTEKCEKKMLFNDIRASSSRLVSLEPTLEGRSFNELGIV